MKKISLKKIMMMIMICFFVSLVSACTKKEPTVIEHVDIYEIQTQITNTIDTVSSGCVAIKTENSEGVLLSTGSGVIYKKEDLAEEEGYKYYVITNNHVIADGVKFEIYMQSSIFALNFSATLIGTDPDYDIAVLTFEAAGDYHVNPLKEDNIVKKGQFVISIGTPLSLTYYNSTTLGIVSGFRGYYIQHDGAINPGNSGGPLFDIDGRLIGINVAKRTMVYPNTNDYTAAEGIGFAIEIKTVISCVEKIESSGTEIHRPTLGVTVTSFAGYRALFQEEESFDDSFIPTDLEEGIVVTKVLPDSPAGFAGMLEKDIILSIDGVSVTDNTALRQELWKNNIGDTIMVKVLRNHIEVELSVTL